MALQTWLALLLCLFFFAVSVYSLISYIKTGEKSVFPLQTENAQKIILAGSCYCHRSYERSFFRS